MTTVNIYLNFNGNCEQAFDFYKSVFRLEYSYFSRFKDMPQTESMASLSKDEAQRVLHVALPISKETVLFGSDTIGEKSSNLVKGNNFSVNVTVDSVEEANRLFKHLSVGGHVIVPLNTTFWGAYFGQFTDKFGINWMISFESNQN
jgi:PhnB protein